MNWLAVNGFLLYRLLKLEYFILRTGYYLVEWIGAKQQGLVN